MEDRTTHSHLLSVIHRVARNEEMMTEPGHIKIRAGVQKIALPELQLQIRPIFEFGHLQPVEMRRSRAMVITPGSHSGNPASDSRPGSRLS